jgi:hypothetical protein
MSGIFDRIKRDLPENTKRLAISKLYASFWQLIEGDITVADIISRFELTGDEITDISAVASTVGATIAAADDQQLERIRIHHKYTHTLMCVEFGYLDEVSARAKLGL